MDYRTLLNVIDNSSIAEITIKVFEEHGWPKEKVTMSRWALHKKCCDIIANKHFVGEEGTVDRYTVLEGLSADVYRATYKVAFEDFTKGTDEEGRSDLYKTTPDIIDLKLGRFIEVTVTTGIWRGAHERKKTENPGKLVTVYTFSFVDLEHSPEVYLDLDEETIGLINNELTLYRERMTEAGLWSMAEVDEETGPERFCLNDHRTARELADLPYTTYGGREGYKLWKKQKLRMMPELKRRVDEAAANMATAGPKLKKVTLEHLHGLKVKGEEECPYRLPFLGRHAVGFPTQNMEPLRALQKVLNELNFTGKKVEVEVSSRAERERPEESVEGAKLRAKVVNKAINEIISKGEGAKFDPKEIHGPRWKWVEEEEENMFEKPFEEPNDYNSCSWLEEEEKFFCRPSKVVSYPEMVDLNSYNRIDEIENITMKALLDDCISTKGAEYCKKVEMTFNIVRNLIEKRREEGLFVPIISRGEGNGLRTWGFLMKGRSHTRRDTDKTDMLVCEFAMFSLDEQKSIYRNGDLLKTNVFITDNNSGETRELKLRVRRYPIDRMRSYFFSNINYSFVLPVNVTSMIMYNQLSLRRSDGQPERVVADALQEKRISGRMFSGSPFNVNFRGLNRMYFARQISYCCLNNSQLEGTQCELRRLMLLHQIIIDNGYAYVFDIEGMKEKLQECIHSNPLSILETKGFKREVGDYS